MDNKVIVDNESKSNIRNRIGKIDFSKYGPLIALIVLFIISAIASPYFLKPRNLSNILRQVSYTGIIALGMTFVIISGGIDLSVGSMIALVGGIVILVLNYFGGGLMAIIIAIILGILVGSGFGAINGLIVTKGKVAPFVATLGTMAIFRSLTLYISGAGLGIPIPAWILIGFTVFFSIILNHTRYGRYICAVGSNERVAKYSAIKVNYIRFISYVIVGFNVAIASVLLSSRLNSISSSNAGSGFELDAIAAVVIGGTSMAGGRGSIVGTLIGAITLGIINNMLNMIGVSPYLQGTVKGLVIIGAVLLQRKDRGI